VLLVHGTQLLLLLPLLLLLLVNIYCISYPNKT
jgi:hypothetical protein